MVMQNERGKKGARGRQREKGRKGEMGNGKWEKGERGEGFSLCGHSKVSGYPLMGLINASNQCD